MGEADKLTKKPGGDWPPAFWAGLSATLATAVLLLIAPNWALLPVGAYVCACLAAPFIPTAGFFLPVISRGTHEGKRVALTFDDGPYSGTTPHLLDLLRAHSLFATFFVVGERAAAHPEIVREIVRSNHEIGNHSNSHDNFLMLRRPSKLRREVESCQAVLRNLGVETFIFRPPIGITNPHLRKVLKEFGLTCVNFSRRGGDSGNRKVEGLAKRVLARVRAGDIVLLHDCCMNDGISVKDWLDEIRLLITGLHAQGFEVVKLSDLIGFPVMKS
ncbi:polysaccharide deacetylase family protein [Thermodesulfobacteriota bacterium]